MRLRLYVIGFLTYGLCGLRGKALAVFLLAAVPLTSGPVMGQEPVTVLALGDSLTQGYGLPQEDGFVPALGRWLGANGASARLINGGVSGDTTQGGAARVEWSLTDDVDAMIVTLGGNDLLRGIDPAVSRANLDRILSAAKERDVKVLLIGLIAPGNYGPDYKAAFDTIYPDLAARYDTLYVANFFQGLADGTGVQTAYFQRDGIHPNADGVDLIVARIGPTVLDLIAQARP